MLSVWFGEEMKFPDGSLRFGLGNKLKSSALTGFTVTVIGLCHDDDGRVIVERNPGGRTWSMPAWLMRLMFDDRKRKRAA